MSQGCVSGQDIVVRSRWIKVCCIAVAAAAVLAIVPVTARADLAPTWISQYQAPTPGGWPRSVAQRMLADGSYMTVIQLGSGRLFVATRYSTSGVRLTTTPPFMIDTTFASIVIGPFGEVYGVGAQLNSYKLDGSYTVAAWKYDGMTGNALWSNPRVILSAATAGSVNITATALDSHGNLVAVGKNSSSIALFKWSNVDGTPLWSRTFAGDGSAARVAVAADDTIAIAAYAPSAVRTIKTDVNGLALWTRDGPALASRLVWAIAIMPNGTITVAGSGELSTGDYRLLLYRYDSAGTSLWSIAQPTGASLGSTYLTCDAAGNAAVAAIASASSYDALVYKFMPSGELLWSKTYAAPNTDFVRGVVTDGGGNVIVSIQSVLGVTSLVVVKYAAGTGNVLWTYTASPDSNLDVTAPVIDGEGNIWVPTDWVTALRVFRVNGATGGLLWTALHPNVRGQEQPAGIGVDSHGDVIEAVTSGSISVNGGMGVVKYSGDTGAVIWSSKVAPLLSAAFTTAIAVDANDDAYVFGVQCCPYAFVLAKFNGATGTNVWTRTLAGSSATARALTIDSSGNPIFVGTISAATQDVLTAKYDSAGTLQWQHTFDSSGYDTPVGVATDAAGNVFVPITGNPTFYGVQYAPGGATNWLMNYGSSAPTPVAVAVAPTGEIYVTGRGSFSRFGTVRISSAGAIVWTKYYGAGGGLDIPAEVLLNGTEVVVAGLSNSPTVSGRADYTFVRYATADGTQLTAFSYPGTMKLNTGNQPTHIGVDTLGNIVLAGSAYVDAQRDEDAMFVKFSPAGAVVNGPLYIHRAFLDHPTSLRMFGDKIFADFSSGETKSDAWTVRVDPSFAVLTATDQLPPGFCGQPYSADIVALNGTAPLTWSVVSGSLPAGVSLTSSTGHLSGTPLTRQSTTFRVRVEDSMGLFIERDYNVSIGVANEYFRINSTENPTCNPTTLSVPPGYAVEQWYPGLETTPTILVNPPHSTLYGVVADQGGSCVTLGSVGIDVMPPLAAVRVAVTGSTTVCHGGTAGSATVSESGGGTSTHQWGYRTTPGGPITNIGGQTGTSYPIAAADFPAGGGTFYLVCTSSPSCGSPMTSNETAIAIDDPSAPSALSATATGNNQVSLSWSGSTGSGVHHYKIYRSDRLCPGLSFTYIGRTTGTETTFVDTTVVTGGNYSYKVSATNSGDTCESALSNCDDAVAYGSCALPPTFTGAAAASENGCFIRVSWAGATSSCPSFPQVVYNIYRSTSSSFTPSSANRIASCVIDTPYDDDSVVAGTTYYYIVRAEDSSSGHGGPCNGGNQDSNVTVVSATAAGTPTVSTVYADAFEAPNRPAANPGAYWIEQAVLGSDHLSLSTCKSASTNTSYKWGSTSACPGLYDIYVTSNLTLGGDGSVSPAINGIAIPAALTNVRLRFNHYYNIEPGWDGAALYYSTTGANGTFNIVNDVVTGGQPYIISGGYDRALISGEGNHRAWTAQHLSFTPVVVNLDALAGQTVWFRWHFYSDNVVQYEGYYLDDVAITGDTLLSCSAPPNPVEALTATSTDASNQLEWINPSSGAYGSTMIRFRTDTFPTSASDGTLAVTRTGVAGAHDTWTHTGLANGTTYYYAAFVDNGSGVWSRARTVAARPETVDGAVKWVYATGASAMTPPGIGSIFAVSNDRMLHSMNVGTNGGNWPATWLPPLMNAPSQSRPTVVPMTINQINGAPKVTFISSQDGYVYAINAITGAELWSTQIGDTVQAAPSLALRQYGIALGSDLVIAGTRNTSSQNGLYALNTQGGTVSWSYTGDGIYKIGIIGGDAYIHYPTKRIYFASRAFSNAANENHTLWCLSFTDNTVTRLWSVPLGDIDGSVVVGSNNTLYAGTNSGIVYAINANDGSVVASYSTGDGPVKGFIFPLSGGNLYFSTTNKVWRLVDNLTAPRTLTLAWSITSIASPSIAVAGSANLANLYVGSSDGSLYRLTSLTTATPAITSVVLGGGNAAVGTIGYDYQNNLAYVGTARGAIYAVSLP